MIVGVSFALSSAGWLTRTGMLVGLVAVLAVAVPVALWRRKTGFPWQRSFETARLGLRDPAVSMLAGLVMLALGYALALGLGTSANDWDSLIYHLPRAVLWLQQGSIGYIGHATDLRLNAMPPNAEIISMFTMLTSGGDQFVALGQFAALVAAGVGICGIARRAGLCRRQRCSALPCS